MNRRGHFKRGDFPPALVNKLALFVFNGFNDEECAILCNLPVHTVKALRNGTNDVRVKYQTLQLKHAAIQKIKAGRGKLSGLMWFLERRFPRQYARADVQLTLASGTTTNNTLLVTAEVAESLIKRSNKAVHEIDELIKAKAPAEQLDSE